MIPHIVLVNEILKNEKYRAAIKVLKGFRNGAVYGAKVRFPHALVTTLLFRSGSIKDLSILILQATYTHSKNLAFFVTIYKILLTLFQKYNILVADACQLKHFVAAFIGGFLIFGRENKINEQINLYLLARVVYGLIKLLSHKGFLPKSGSKISFPLFGAFVWGIAVWMFESNQWALQSSLQASMTYLYRDSNHWRSLKDFLFSNTA